MDIDVALGAAGLAAKTGALTGCVLGGFNSLSAALLAEVQASGGSIGAS